MRASRELSPSAGDPLESGGFDCTAVDDLLAEIRLNQSLAADHLPINQPEQPQ